MHETSLGRLTGVICDVEAYPAFVDGVHHGNRRTKRSEVMWQDGGLAYVYVVYGQWNQFAAVVNVEGVPDVVFVRAIFPLEGVDSMIAQWPGGRAVSTLCDSPGKLCRSMLIGTELYGADLCGGDLYLEDRGLVVPEAAVRTARRVGINSAREGFDAPLRFYVKPTDLDLPTTTG